MAFSITPTNPIRIQHQPSERSSSKSPFSSTIFEPKLKEKKEGKEKRKKEENLRINKVLQGLSRS
ncbi:unnamed protein product [Cuscuta epithymum]|uniref:Uncharacterized protein n=1 Tax=Cuscuta epithymum TaxID=186058 RepID=A0AAV0GFX8_9ASTE|nr:unnamed protein product [Cuscuta epithymum]